MCFNAPVSLITFIIGIVGSIRLYLLGQKPEAIFFAWVCLMQLIEFFLWRNQSCNDVNKKFTYAGMIVNHLEPVVLWIAILYYNKKLPDWVNISMVLYLILMFLYTKGLLKNRKDFECTEVTEESTPHLHWKWNYGNYYKLFYSFFLICLIILSFYGVDKGYVSAGITLISYAISYVVYDKYKSVGAMWCFLAAFCPWIIPIVKDLF